MGDMADTTRHHGVEVLWGSESACQVFGRAAARLAVL
jgi:hypothetical protein